MHEFVNVFLLARNELYEFVCVQPVESVDIWEADAICDPFLVSIDNVKVTILLSHCPTQTWRKEQGLSRICFRKLWKTGQTWQTWLPNCQRVQNIEKKGHRRTWWQPHHFQRSALWCSRRWFFSWHHSVRRTPRKTLFRAKNGSAAASTETQHGLTMADRHENCFTYQMALYISDWRDTTIWSKPAAVGHLGHKRFLSKKVRSAPWGSPGP